MGTFLLTRPLRDVTALENGKYYIQDISTHTPLAGRDRRKSAWPGIYKKFLLTRPLRDVTASVEKLAVSVEFLLTRPLRDVTATELNVQAVKLISTHTPLAGRDRRLYEYSS